ncbi:MAG TPA: hypothetical protein VNK52_16945 [Hyphomicrobiaceae bacterium]|nr:hypothetical protein [Hyphomicrobiaceae bacterium]
MFRGLLSAAFAAALLAVVLGRYAPQAATVEQAMWNVMTLGLVALGYTALQGINAIRQSANREHGVFLGLVLSFLPLFVVAYAVAVWQYAPNQLTTYQTIAMILGGAAAAVDVFLFSWLTFRTSRGLTLRERRA